MGNKYDPFKSDLWSVGVTLYIFLAEVYPFDSDHELELQIKIAENPVAFPEYFDDETKDFITKLLNKDPKLRLVDYSYLN
jgi:serine/threonine protein kinase